MCNRENWRNVLLSTRAPAWSILIRLLVGLVVFFPEGIQNVLVTLARCFYPTSIDATADAE
jgi:hypothetical protein